MSGADGENATSAGTMSEGVKACVEAFKNGKPCMVFDSAFREGETDLLFPGIGTKPEWIRRLRKECGGLLFLAIGDEVGEMFGMPYLQDLFKEMEGSHAVLKALDTTDLQYDSRSAFTVSLNHRKTFTGITDKDRALTTARFAELTKELLDEKADQEACIKRLGEEFRTPGHIPVCRESPGGLKNRRGHTELAVSIARLAGLAPVTIGAEMLAPEGDLALPVEEARAYAKKHGIPMVEGYELLEAHGFAKEASTEEPDAKKAKTDE
ncbi:3,4-dihydroxy-2-butanone 4-phosphate synthase [Hondaea fermentalgiana]|uniref:3,4-dihydroxy-2-butanone 4-phosphate synthase n=1 Tax=Hondaea fermentalgiana TaxID=2315210 RepID=A0A2R5GS09_9STRA|nr:3,4-dihydroxy-2-butanone 4-phosphate synthase [Hondaea fermentalgiana]|eukprot:GBG30664.1 3,4-dihydroxy-2-butanone 4-phosphate synthase [Hondaea fermentalgiana]